MRRGPLLLFWPLAVSAYESGSRGGEKVEMPSKYLPPFLLLLLASCNFAAIPLEAPAAGARSPLAVFKTGVWDSSSIEFILH